MDIINDRQLDIAVGSGRTAKSWKNKKMTWGALLDRLSKPTITQETMAEYKAMSRDQKSKVKDVGGFVAGYVNNGNRSDVRHRSCITLDADSIVSDIWSDWLDLYGNAACIYSTHSHTPEAPRYRLIIPTDRDMSPDEYQAVSRRIADTLGMDNFDESTHQVQRLMYWGSCCRDGEYIFHNNDAEFIHVDDVLSSYVDWKDMSAWPTNSKLPENLKKAADKQKDPLEKKGIIGAFCRAYFPIQTAIETFIQTYEPCDGGRYTYTEGSTAAGVVIYGDRFSYSNHATDPASMQLCNAWDLVRIHLFGDKDSEAKEGTLVMNLPSYKAMTEFASGDPLVKTQMYQDRKEEAVRDFDEEVEDWHKLLTYNSKGGLEQTIKNAEVILNYDPEFSGKISMDLMRQNIIVTGDLPWRKLGRKKFIEWKDSDDSQLRRYMEDIGLQGKDRLFDAVNNTAENHARHPVKEFIEEAEWDGEPRVETIFIDYLGAEDTPYARTVSRKTLVGAVARIYNPGCKFDYVLTLRGRQGVGKSSIISRLAQDWFSDTMTTMQGKEAYEQLQGVWIMEIGELASMKKSDIESIKGFLSKQYDRFRPAYGRRTQDSPRQCIFIATTNEVLFLRDRTGNRRFWILDLPNEPEKKWQDLKDSEVHQIWAEAKHYYDEGETLYLDPEMELEAARIQEAFMEEDGRLGIIEDYLQRDLPDDWELKDLDERRAWLASDAVGTEPRTTVCSMEIYCEALGYPPEKNIDTYELKQINQILARFPEWRSQGNKIKRYRLYKRQRYFLKQGATTEPDTPEDNDNTEDWIL